MFAEKHLQFKFIVLSTLKHCHWLIRDKAHIYLKFLLCMWIIINISIYVIISQLCSTGSVSNTCEWMMHFGYELLLVCLRCKLVTKVLRYFLFFKHISHIAHRFKKYWKWLKGRINILKNIIAHAVGRGRNLLERFVCYGENTDSTLRLSD